MELLRAIPVQQVMSYPQQLHAIVNLIMQKKFQLSEIGDYVLGNVFLGNLKSKDLEVHKFWLTYFEFFFPPEEKIVIQPELYNEIQKRDYRKIHFFFQRSRPRKESDCRWYFSTSRLCTTEQENSSSILFHYAFELKVPESTAEEDYNKAYHARFMLLSKREREIIKLIVEGKSSCEISSMLYISMHTVNNHRKNIIRKLEINNLCQLTRFAIAFQIV